MKKTSLTPAAIKRQEDKKLKIMLTEKSTYSFFYEKVTLKFIRDEAVEITTKLYSAIPEKKFFKVLD